MIQKPISVTLFLMGLSRFLREMVEMLSVLTKDFPRRRLNPDSEEMLASQKPTINNTSFLKAQLSLIPVYIWAVPVLIRATKINDHNGSFDTVIKVSTVKDRWWANLRCWWCWRGRGALVPGPSCRCLYLNRWTETETRTWLNHHSLYPAPSWRLVCLMCVCSEGQNL